MILLDYNPALYRKAVCRILRFWLNVVTISCLRTFLIFIQSIFAFILNGFFFTYFCPFFLLQVCVQEDGEGTTTILHPFVMIWNKKLLKKFC